MATSSWKIRESSEFDISHRGMNRHRVMWVGRDRGDAVPMRGIGT
jgi:hypothetical protein